MAKLKVFASQQKTCHHRPFLCVFIHSFSRLLSLTLSGWGGALNNTRSTYPLWVRPPVRALHWVPCPGGGWESASAMWCRKNEIFEAYQNQLQI